MTKARIAEKTVYFKSNANAVWNAVTNNEDYKWRSDIKKIEVIEDGSQWLEYYDNKNYTKFALVEKTEHIKYVFNMENKMFYGNWTGYFYPTETGGTKLVIRESIFIKNYIVRIISYLFWNLNKIQDTYIRDLKNKLQED